MASATPIEIYLDDETKEILERFIAAVSKLHEDKQIQFVPYPVTPLPTYAYPYPYPPYPIVTCQSSGTQTTNI